MSDLEATCDHFFQTSISREKFEAIITRSCRAPFTIALEASDPTVLPQTRIFCVVFATVEDRERARIAMRFVEKEQLEIVRKSQATPSRAPVRRIATAEA